VLTNRLQALIGGAILLALMISVTGCASLSPQPPATNGATLDSLHKIPAGIKTRWASAENFKGEKGQGGKANGGRKGSPCFPMKAGEKKVLADVTGTSGMVRRIWITIRDRSPEMLRGIRIDMYWDGADKPAVSVPIGDLFCHGLARMATFQNALFSSPEGRSFNCYIPMPFKTGMKIVATNECNKDLSMFFYDVDYTLGDEFDEDTLYFHAHWRRENPTTIQQDYELLPRVTGKGRYLGVNIGVIPDTKRYVRTWWGEGEVKIYLDGDDEYPTLCGTGTEDYIGTGWGQGQYANLYQGCHVADTEKFQYCFYRLHVPDPVYFREDCRVTMQQIGCYNPELRKQLGEIGDPIYIAGPGLVEENMSPDAPPHLFEREDDWSSCAYFYLDQPTSNLPELPPFEQRIAGMK